MKIRTGLAFAFFFAFSPFVVRGEGPSSEPILRIETGMHTGPTYSISADLAGHYLVTGSLDKTARIWDLGSGQLVRILRPPIGSGDEGKISSVAMAPNGELVAVSGWTGAEWDKSFSIYLFDRATGNLVNRLRGLPERPKKIAFSPDGTKMAVSIGGHNGVRVFNIENGEEVSRDSNFGDDCYGLDWDRSGRLVVSSLDGYIRLYNEDLKLAVKTKNRAKNELFDVKFSPDGSKIAVGFNAVYVDVISGIDLHSLYKPRILGIKWGTFAKVAWSYDGQSLYAANIYLQSGQTAIRRWGKAGRGDSQDFLTGASFTTFDLVPLPGGSLAFGAADPAWGVLAFDSTRKLLVKSGISDFKSRDLAIDATGGRVRFGHQYGAKFPSIFSVPDRTLTLESTKEPGLIQPRIEYPGISISRQKDTLTPTIDGRPFKIIANEQFASLAIAHDGRSFLVGTNRSLYSFDRMGNERWRVSAPAFVMAGNLSGDGRLALAAFSDGTIHWYRADNGKELLTFFPFADRKRWVVWTPSGYYDTSVGGEDLIGWHVNRGPDQAADFFPTSRFRDRFYRPGVIGRVLNTLDEATAVAQADTEAQRKTETMALSKLLPPVVTILSPANESEVREASVSFRVTVRSPSGEPVTGVHAYVDGRPAGSARGLVYEPDPQPATPSAERVYTFSIPVPPRDCTVAISAETRLATSDPVPLKLRWGAAPPPIAKSKLYVLAVGVGAYANPAYKLDLPAKDARDVAASWKTQMGGLYRDVEVKLLTDAQATKNGILAGLEWLERETTAKDVAILYFSGHGINDPRSGDYLFLPYESDMGARRTTLLPDREVRSVLSTIPGKVLLFLDTCHSGNLLGTAKTRDATDLTGLLNELASADSGVVVFSASTGRQQAIESSDWKNGAFTRALLEALSGKADLDGDHSLYITEIESYLDKRVKELTRGLQTPVVAKPGGMPDFPVAVW